MNQGREQVTCVPVPRSLLTIRLVRVTRQPQAEAASSESRPSNPISWNGLAVFGSSLDAC